VLLVIVSGMVNGVPLVKPIAVKFLVPLVKVIVYGPCPVVEVNVKDGWVLTQVGAPVSVPERVGQGGLFFTIELCLFILLLRNNDFLSPLAELALLSKQMHTKQNRKRLNAFSKTMRVNGEF